MEEYRQEAILIELVKKIEKIIAFKNEHRIVPARATWRELRDVLNQEEWEKLEALVPHGVFKKYDGIHYASYEIDYLKLRQWENMAKAKI